MSESTQRFASTSEIVFSEIYFAQFACTTLTLCMTLFLLSVIDIRSFQAFFLIAYQLAITFLLLVPCWFTSEMTIRSANIPLAAYECGWTEASQSVKKDLLYFIHRTQNPIQIYAIGFFPISVEVFLGIVRSSMSYYAVLNSINAEE